MYNETSGYPESGQNYQTCKGAGINKPHPGEKAVNGNRQMKEKMELTEKEVKVASI